MSAFDDNGDGVREIRGMSHGTERWGEAPRRPPPRQVPGMCATCRRFHGPETTCAIAEAAVEASIAVEGELLGEQEIGDVDRVALIRALAVRGLALEPIGDSATGFHCWRVVRTVAP